MEMTLLSPAGPGLPGVGPHCRHVLPAISFLRLGDVCSCLLLVGDGDTLQLVSFPAPAEALHDSLAYCGEYFMLYCKSRQRLVQVQVLAFGGCGCSFRAFL